ncbi:sarcosine oxidase subunit alpha family protein [Sneathiella litorea]|uniref:Sarcosine oxidase subunit alpha family protein n=1 Tax=Sneathiella litorea TaxID=2606216 RepID=A0A6L8W6M8_9PROT|nr:sarcosine oxidase subunit alpha family protein [Sneathiella litorea]MZR30718.1 sarcosine oxidase subunit alpha family protein [Sneathiella litorea]
MSRISGGIINRDAPISFSFNGQNYQAFEGDTLASALLANGVQLVGRSFKYHRPRGILSAGSEEPNALVQLGRGARLEPNARATVTELYEGLTANSQNHIGPLKRDLMAINDLFAPFLSAGFYYKTFMWPRAFWEKLYEPAIRRAAGLGRLSFKPDPDQYDKGFLHCDLLVIGGGAAGLAAALTAGRAGAKVILADEDFHFGGRLLSESYTLGDALALEWVETVLAELNSLPNVRLMPRTTIFGVYDHGIFGAVERVGDHLPTPHKGLRQTLWRITSKQSILAAGAVERHIPFANNDRPGVMLAGAMRAYANRWAVTPVQSARDPIAIFTNGDDGHRTALDLLAKGVELLGVIDTRADAPRFGDYEVFASAKVSDSKGRHGLAAIEITHKGQPKWHKVGALGVSGGWNPNVHLSSHHRGRPIWDDDLLAFVPPKDGPKGLIPAGAAAGRGCTGDALSTGMNAAITALGILGLPAHKISLPETLSEAHKQEAFWHVPATAVDKKRQRKRAWVDFQNDVTVKDIALAHQENMRPVEHLKRWTTLGMATDQGKTANITALAVMAELTGKTIPETGTTIFRPPYTGVSLSVLGGGDIGQNFRPKRLTPTHKWACTRGAVFVEAGQWMRAQYFPKPGETHWRQSVDREALAVRAGVGVCDVTTLGKIDLQGKDATEFLNRIYANMMGTLPLGKVRYGIMLREDGALYDDGTCARLGENHYVVTTTTANAGLVYRKMEFAHQCLWPELDVQIISATDAWAQLAIAGPRSRELLARINDGFDISNEAFPFMSCAELTICQGLSARLFRISFSGELAYEIAVPARYGNALIERLIEIGQDLGATPYGTETLGVLRIEKGHAAGNEITGQTSALMLGLGNMVSKKKDSIGAIMSRRGEMATESKRLVGLRPINPNDPVVAGSHLLKLGSVLSLEHDEGWITSACYSPHVGSAIGLGYLDRGDARIAEHIIAANPLEGQNIRLEVVSPHFIDPEGERLRD